MMALLLVAAALLLAVVIGDQVRAARPVPTQGRTFVPFPTYAPTAAPSATPIAGLHEYQRPINVEPKPIPVSGSTAAPGGTPPRARRDSTAAGGAGGQARHHTRHQLTGRARWYGTGRDGLYAAAGCALRKAMGDWRGRHVLVAYRRRAVEVRLNDAVGGCTRTLIDLSDEAFRYLAPLSRGVIRVTVGW